MPQPARSDPQARAQKRRRLIGLDASRGAAMSLVCLAHFQDAYLYPLSVRVAGGELTRLTLAATPSFILISGFILGFLYSAHRRTFDDLRRKLVDRALFLLTVARLLIIAAHVPMIGLHGALNIVFVTDTIAVCVLVGCALVPTTGFRFRAALGILLYAITAILLLGWRPQPGSPEQVLKHLAFGHHPGRELSVFAYSFPVLPWLAVYLVATALGNLSGRRRSANGEPDLSGMIGFGALLTASAVVVWLLRPVLAGLSVFAGGSGAITLRFLTTPWQKLPPGPIYLAFYVGVALFLVSACLWIERVRADALPLRALALLGRNSLFVFVLQYFIYYSLLYSLHLPYTRLWPLLFVASYAVLFPAVLLWERRDGQRLLTVGYPGVVAWASRLRAAR